jgi:class 3 adenylate cyclase
VRIALHDRLKKHDALVGFSSAACGSDILFLQTLLALQGEAHVILPYDRVQFARDSVDIVPGWKHHYDALIETLTTNSNTPPRVVEVAQGKMELQSISYEYANLVLHGLAMRRAKELDSELACLAVWDGRPGDGPYGTASVVDRWKKLGLEVDQINVAEMLQNQYPALALVDDPSRPAETAVCQTPPPPETKVLAMLFADAVGYSRLAEREAVNFTRHCLNAICKLLLDWPQEAIVRESRGDGVYLAIETVRDAGLFALALCDLMTNTTWTDRGLPAHLQLRIGLHAGPVCRCFDPILGSQTWTGAHVSRAARIEQSGQGGLVCASQEFAALAAVEHVTEFSCDYVETREMPKQYGPLPLYIVSRRGNPQPCGEMNTLAAR